MTPEALDPQPLPAGGGNFRLDTDLGPLHVMQWIAGIDAGNLYGELEAAALTFTLDDVPHRYCSPRTPADAYQPGMVSRADGMRTTRKSDACLRVDASALATQARPAGATS